ncbi:MAG: hypothetical protein V3R99_03860 [Thermoguttaceae bacterium]
MRRRVAWCSLVLLTLAGGKGHAQQPTTVQLPTLSVFSGRTTVVVPDRGSTYMGGVRRAASGRSEFGVPMLPFRPFRNTAIGNERSVSSLRVSATVHDFEAMDEFLLSRPTSFRQQHAMQRPTMQQRVFLPWPAAPATAAYRPDPRVGSSWKLATPQPEVSVENRVARIQAQSRGRRVAEAAEAADFFERGKKAEESGKLSVAKIYYRMAARRADDQLRSAVVARLEAIARTETGSQVAQNGP